MLIRLFRFLSVFPLPFLHAVGIVLGYLVYGLSPTYRRRMRANMALAGYEQHIGVALREAGKALGVDPAIVDRVAKNHHGFDSRADLLQRFAEAIIFDARPRYHGSRFNHS